MSVHLPEGNTAVYLPYAHARICSIIRKFGKNIDELKKDGEIVLDHPDERALGLYFPVVNYIAISEALYFPVVNYIAISEALGISSSVIATGVATNNVICAIYFMVLFALASKVPPKTSELSIRR